MQMSRFWFFPHDALLTVSNTAWKKTISKNSCQYETGNRSYRLHRNGREASKLVLLRGAARFQLALVANGLWRPHLGCVAEMAPDYRKIKCTTRLGALDASRSSAHRSQGVCWLSHTVSHLFVRGKIAWHPHTKDFLCIARFQRRFVDNIGGLYRWFWRVIHWYLHLVWLNMSLDDSDQLTRSLRLDCKSLQSVMESMLLKILVSSA